MKFIKHQMQCGEILLEAMNQEIMEVEEVISEICWSPEFKLQTDKSLLMNQTAYNKAFANCFACRDWLLQPKLNDSPKLIGDFSKHLVFGEIQFGNSSTLYRDYYKFQYGHRNGKLSLAILITPNDELSFFPTRKASVRNMANARLALRYFSILPISVPTIIYGLLANNG